MMRRIAALWICGVCLIAAPAMEAKACEGSNIIFEDSFSDDAGGWSLKDSVEIDNGAFALKLAPDDMQADLNVTYTVNDADICADTVWPTGASPILGAGLLFWGEDKDDYYQFGILNNGKYWIARRQDGKWSSIAENVPSPAINTSPGGSNTLRVEADEDSASFFINGTKLRDLRGQGPSAGWRFGLSGDNFDKDKDARLTFTHVKVTN